VSCLTPFYLLKPSVCFNYCQVQHPKILYGDYIAFTQCSVWLSEQTAILAFYSIFFQKLCHQVPQAVTYKCFSDVNMFNTKWKRKWILKYFLLNFTAYFSHLLNGPKLSTVTLLIKVHSLEHTTSSCLYQVVTINSSLVPTISKHLQHPKACSTCVSTKSEYLPDPYSYIIRLATVAIHLNV